MCSVQWWRRQQQRPQRASIPAPPRPIPRQIGGACRSELLSWEQGFNAQQAAWGQSAFWIWQPLFSACGLTGGGGGGTQAPPLVNGGGGLEGEAPEETFCDKASQAAEEVGVGMRDREAGEGPGHVIMSAGSSPCPAAQLPSRPVGGCQARQTGKCLH